MSSISQTPNVYTRHVLATVLVPSTLNDPGGSLISILDQVPCQGPVSLGGAWKNPFRALYQFLTLTDLRNIRIFATPVGEDLVDIELAMNSFPVNILIEKDWMPQAIITPTGNLFWVEEITRPKWGKKVKALFDRFKDCHAVVVDLLLPDDDYRMNAQIVPLKGERGNAVA